MKVSYSLNRKDLLIFSRFLSEQRIDLQADF